MAALGEGALAYERGTPVIQSAGVEYFGLQVSAETWSRGPACLTRALVDLQGYLAHKKHPNRRNLQQP
jgi:hypothetical protein